MRFSSIIILLLAFSFSFSPVRGSQRPQTCEDWFLYHTDQTGDWEIFRSTDRPDHGINLTEGSGPRVYDVAPTLSPDRSQFAFASLRDGNWEIYLGDTDKAAPRRVTTAKQSADIDPVWSPVGDWIAYESGIDGEADWDIWLYDVTAGTSSQLTDHPAIDINPYWSPDGSTLLFQSDRDGLWQIYALELKTLTLTRLSDGLGDDHDPAYSPNGNQIVFRSFRTTDTSVLYVMDADGANPHPISDPAGSATNAAWSPDGSLIAYQSDLDADLDIYIYDLASGSTRLLTANDTFDYAPAWRCDASTVLFTSDETGNTNIYEAAVLPLDAPPIRVESGAQALTSLPATEQYPLLWPSEENASRQGALPGPAIHE